MYNIFLRFQLKSVQNRITRNRNAHLSKHRSRCNFARTFASPLVWTDVSLGFLFAWGLATYRSKQRGWTPDMVSDLIFFGALGVIIGGRVGYVYSTVFSVFGKPTLAVPDLDRWHEFPRRFPRRNPGNVMVVQEIQNGLVPDARLYCTPAFRQV